METKQLINKQKSNVFGKDVYLIGTDEFGTKYWLEAPSWDCGWYWGFGYIETYTNNAHPERSIDISSHQHWSNFVGQQENYDYKKQCFVKGEYIHNIYDSSSFSSLTFTQEQGWELSELFQQFYLLKEFAEFCHHTPSGCNITTVDAGLGNLKDWETKINQELIPKVTEKIINILV